MVPISWFLLSLLSSSPVPKVYIILCPPALFLILFSSSIALLFHPAPFKLSSLKVKSSYWKNIYHAQLYDLFWNWLYNYKFYSYNWRWNIVTTVCHFLWCVWCYHIYWLYYISQGDITVLISCPSLYVNSEIAWDHKKYYRLLPKNQELSQIGRNFTHPISLKKYALTTDQNPKTNYTWKTSLRRNHFPGVFDTRNKGTYQKQFTAAT